MDKFTTQYSIRTRGTGRGREHAKGHIYGARVLDTSRTVSESPAIFARSERRITGLPRSRPRCFEQKTIAHIRGGDVPSAARQRHRFRKFTPIRG